MNLLAVFILAIGLTFFIESLPWLIAPQKMKDFLLELREARSDMLRYWGIFLLAMSLVFVWIGSKLLS